MAHNHTPTPLKVFETLHQLLHLFRREVRQKIEHSESNLTFGEFRVLSFIGQHPDCTPSTLVEFSRTDKAQIARTISGLENLGLVERRQCDKDRRKHRLNLTKEGYKIHQELGRYRTESATRLLQHCDEQELEELLELLCTACASAQDSIP